MQPNARDLGARKSDLTLLRNITVGIVSNRLEDSPGMIVITNYRFTAKSSDYLSLPSVSQLVISFLTPPWRLVLVEQHTGGRRRVAGTLLEEIGLCSPRIHT